MCEALHCLPRLAESVLFRSCQKADLGSGDLLQYWVQSGAGEEAEILVY